MTTTFKSFLALLLVIGSTGLAHADQRPPGQAEPVLQLPERQAAGNLESIDRIAWQRVGSPVREA